MIADALSKKRELPAMLVAWVCLSLAGTMFIWTLRTYPADLADPEVGLAGYLAYLAVAAAAAGVICGALYALGAGGALARLSLAAALLYLSALKAAGVVLMPWLALVLTLAGAVALPRQVRITAMLALTHVMGTLAGLYLIFSLERYLAGWRPFLDVLRAMWLIVAGAVSSI
jgi:hypothetical protein